MRWVRERLYLSPDVPGPVQIHDSHLSIAINSIPYDSQKYPGLKEYDVTYIWNLKYNINELIYKIETDSQM